MKSLYASPAFLHQRLFFFLFSLSIFLVSCRKKPEPVAEDYILTRGLALYYRDANTNQLLIGVNGERFHADSVKAYKWVNRNGEMIGGGSRDSIGQYRCGFIYLFETALGPRDIERFVFDIPVYIYLNAADTDTIRIRKQFQSSIVVSYNDSVVADIPALDERLSYPLIIKKKP